MFRPLALTAALCAPWLCPAAEAAAAPPKATLEARLREVAALEDARAPVAAFALALSAPETALRARAVRALGRHQDPAAAPALTAALSDAAADVRLEAAFAAGQLKTFAPEVLRARLASARAPRDAALRRTLLRALGKLGGSAEVPTLWAVATDAKAPTAERAEALISLGLLAKRQDGALAEPDASGPGALARLIAQALGTPGLRFGLGYLLLRATRWPDAVVVPAARTLLADAEPEVRAEACRALGGRAAPEAHQALRSALADAEPRVRVEAARALGRSADLPGLTLAVEAAAAALATPARLAGPDLAPLVEGLDAALEAAAGRPDLEHAALLRAARRVLQAGPVDDRAAPGVRLGWSHLRCRAAALVDAAEGDVRNLAVCGEPTLPAMVREGLLAPRLAALPAARREAALDAFEATATPAGRAALLEALGTGPGGAAADAPRVLAALAVRDSAVRGEAAAAAARLKLANAGPALARALRESLEAGPTEAETVQSVLEAIAEMAEGFSPPERAELGLLVAAARLAPASPALAPLLETAARALGLGPGPAAQAPSPTRAFAAPAAAPEPPPPPPTRARLRTTKGDVWLTLRPDEAPRTVENFARLARAGFYDGLLFHRVVPDFVAQGGDPRGDGYGGPGHTIRCEVGPLGYPRGAVGMALAGKDTGGSQFFITLAAHPHLEGGYTVFAKVAAGQEVVDALAVGDRILGISLEPDAPRARDR